ncbi:MAG: ABC transporter ATP-binding protein [Alphaproteobacteria bacterium]|nr:ABC transporter ATP-binding protein [Alphaproteobacteria bacterium]
MTETGATATGADPTAPILAFEGVGISFFLRAGEANVIPALSFSIRRREALGLVGESGCGKSTVALAILRYLGRAGRQTGGRILFEGRDMATLGEAELRAIRGRRIAMVYQDPMSSLNPVMTIGRQLAEVPMIHEGISADAARARALEMLNEVKLPDPQAILERYPHQLSGGQQQRIVIAMALIAKPVLLIMDEPTTGLDVTVEAAVLDLVRELRQRHDTAILFISHNLGTVAHICDRVGVMYGGELVEDGPVGAVFGAPRHPYTRGLLDCLPTLGRDKRSATLRSIPGQVGSLLQRPAGCTFAARCAHVAAGRCTTAPIPSIAIAQGQRVLCVRAAELAPWRRPQSEPATGDSIGSREPALALHRLGKIYSQGSGIFGSGRRSVSALGDVELTAERGRTLAIVGESGCGKSTLARIIAGLQTVTTGTVEHDNADIGALPVEQRSAALKRKLQMVFQNPDSTLNPSHSVGYAIGRAVRRLRGLSAGAARTEVERLLATVKLPGEFARRRPHQLSGGQKQRAAIARALAGEPEIIIADEPVSALDVSVQAAIINLLAELQAERQTTLVFISHDLAVVRYLADSVAVMYLGRIVEFGSVAQVFAPPWHPYTEALLSAVPEPDPENRKQRIALEGNLPSLAEVPKGCPFVTRCPRKLGTICEETPPPEHRLDGGHRILCHIPIAELQGMQAGGGAHAEMIAEPLH